MSKNLDVVRSIYADWERGDFGSVEWADPEIEWVLPDGPSPSAWTGHEGMAVGFREWVSAWSDLRVEVEEIHEIDSEHVIVFSRASGHGKTSGIDLGGTWFRGTIVFRICQAKVVRLAVYADRERALADLGLTPEGDP